MREVAIAVPVTVAYQRYSDADAPWYFGAALRELLQRAGIAKTDVDGLTVSSFTLAPDGPASLVNHFDMSVRWLESVPYGGASGIIAMRRAVRAVQTGDAEIVACLAADTHRPGSFADLVHSFSRFSNSAVVPYGGAGPNGVFALLADAYMQRYGLDRRDLGRLCVAQRQNALSNPNALMQTALSLDDYLSARTIVAPLHLYDCVMPCAGAEGFLVMPTQRARALQLPVAHLVASAERHNAYFDDPVQYRGGWDLDRDRLYAEAETSPSEIDFVQTYDDYPVLALMQLEDMGFLTKGGGAEFLQRTDLTVAGDLPHNTCGGQLSCGQAGAAGGFLGSVEAIRQLTDSPLGDQVANARRGVVTGYGMVNYDRCVCTAAAILSRGEE